MLCKLSAPHKPSRIGIYERVLGCCIAPAHTNNWMTEKRLIVCYLPPYSPELNLIEILWRKIKYAWLNLQTIMNFDEFQKELTRVLEAVGEEYMISFV